VNRLMGYGAKEGVKEGANGGGESVGWCLDTGSWEKQLEGG
jgi:hypothetical protein